MRRSIHQGIHITRPVVFLMLASQFTMGWSQANIDNKTREIIARNKVKSQISWEYKYVGDKPETSGLKTSLTIYNAAGDVSEVTSYNPKGLVLNLEKYRYDAAGNKLEYTRYSGGAEGQIAYQKISKYDSRNNIIQESGYDGVEKFNNLYTYDAQGNLAEIQYQKNGVPGEKRVFKKDGLKTHVSIYNASGKMISKMELTYDARNNLLEEIVYGVNQDILERKTYDYDEKKNLRAEAKYKLNKMTLRTTYTYNAAGNVTEVSEESAEGGKYIKKSYRYNAGGDIVELKWRRRSSEEFNSITYQYDSKGLCTQSDTFYPSTQYRALTKYTYELN